MRDWVRGESPVVEGPRGQIAHPRAFEQSERLERRLYTVRPGVWCLVGNGLSNQTFVEGPEGIIAIDTGESVEEMRSALDELASVTDRPVVAVIYTHFHYVSGTREILDRYGNDLPVHGHERISVNLSRVTSEIAPSYMRGIVQQFALRLPLDGPDGQVNVGLGLHYRNPDHAPFTPGHVPVTLPWRGGERLTIAGLELHVHHAPSDSDDSVTLWFPGLDLCVQNIVWPLVFNVYAIRGEEYRDPMVLLPGIDHVLSLNAEHLVCTHGPPLSGRDEVRRRTTRYRDSIQLMWDQTVRLANRGRSMDEIAHMVRLPENSDDDYYTTEYYGLVEHHVRQIYTGIRGWFDDDPEHLLPLEPHERADRLIAGFGGADVVRDVVRKAVDEHDLRWALETASWLVKSSFATDTDRRSLADVLRAVAYRTTAANIRNWCLTRARDIDGTEPLDRLRTHRLREEQVVAMSPTSSIDILRVFVDPERAEGLDVHLAVQFEADRIGLHLRNGVSVRTDGTGAEHTIRLTYRTWARLLAGKVSLDECEAVGELSIDGDATLVRRALRVFELPGLGDRS